MSESWSEVIARVGKDPSYHWEMGPDPDGLGVVLIQYREFDDATKQWVTIGDGISIPTDLVEHFVAKIRLVAKHIEDNDE